MLEDLTITPDATLLVAREVLIAELTRVSIRTLKDRISLDHQGQHCCKYAYHEYS